MGNDIEDFAIIAGLAVVGYLAYETFFPKKSLDEILAELDKGVQDILGSIKLPTLPPIPMPMIPPQPQMQQAAAVPEAAPNIPITPTEPAAPATNTIPEQNEPEIIEPPKKPKDSGQLPTNPTVPPPPSGSGGAIVAFAGDFDNTNGTKATMQSMDKHNVSMIIGAGDYAYSGTSASWYNSVIGGTRFKGKMIGAKGNHDDGAYQALFGQPGYLFQRKVAPNLAVVVIPAASSVDEAKLTQLTQEAKASAKHVAYVFHEPYITSDNGHHKGGECKAGPTIEKVARALGVKLIVAGHNHLYEHFTCNGIHYVTSGAAGRKFYPGNCQNKTCAPAKCVEDTNGFLKVAVGNSLLCQFVANNGQVLDTFTIA